MFKNRAAWLQIGIVLVAFLTGIVLGRWNTIPKAAFPLSIAQDDAVANRAPKATTRSPLPTSTASNSQNEDEDSEKPSPRTNKSLDEIVKGRDLHNRTEELQAFVSSLTSADFGAALKKLRQMPEGNARELATRLLVARWSEIDPEAALKFASQNREFDYIAGDVFQQLASDDLQSAIGRAKEISDPNIRYQALRGALGYMAEFDPAGALRLASSVGNFANSEPLSQVIYRQWSSVDPQAAAAQAAQDPSTSGWRSPIGQVLRNWANQDPIAAINWALTSSDSESQARDIGQVMRQWSRQDFPAAANWVNTLPAGNVRDAAAASLGFSLASTDPRGAIRWIDSMADTTQRDAALQRISREIMYRDPTNGLALLQSAGVPANLIPPPPDPNQRGGGGRGRRP